MDLNISTWIVNCSTILSCAGTQTDGVQEVASIHTGILGLEDNQLRVVTASELIQPEVGPALLTVDDRAKMKPVKLLCSTALLFEGNLDFFDPDAGFCFVHRPNRVGFAWCHVR